MCNKEDKWQKNCPVCGKILYFNTKFELIRAIKRNSTCRDCMYKINKLLPKEKKEIKEKLKLNKSLYLLNKLLKNPTKYKKNCPTCGKIITYSCKDTLRESLKGNWECRSCSQKYPRINPKEKIKKKEIRQKKYYKEYKLKLKTDKKFNEKEKQKRKEYKQRPEVIKREKKYKKEYNKEYRQKPEVKKRKQKRIKRLRQTPMGKLNYNISTNIRRSLKYNNLSKHKRHWENIIGYTVQELKEHLEKLFKPGMNWNNYGKNGWVIDHKIPIAFFIFKSINDVEFKYCWSLYNLQPLWEENNIKKKDKIILWGKEINAKKYRDAH